MPSLHLSTVFPLLMAFASDEKSKKFQLIRYCSAQSGFPMRVSDSSVGGAAGQFHTARLAAVMVSVDGPSQSATLEFCEALVATKRGLSP